MRGLTINQPFAWAIIIGHKSVENRTWAPPRELLGERIAIHASRRVTDPETKRKIECDHGIVIPVGLPFGAVIGSVVISEIVRESHDRWFTGPLAWRLSNPIAIQPIPCRGAQRLWTVPEDIANMLTGKYVG